MTSSVNSYHFRALTLAVLLSNIRFSSVDNLFPKLEGGLFRQLWS